MFYGVFSNASKRTERTQEVQFSDSDELQDVNMLKKYRKAGNFMMEVFYACNFHLFLHS